MEKGKKDSETEQKDESNGETDENDRVARDNYFIGKNKMALQSYTDQFKNKTSQPC